MDEIKSLSFHIFSIVISWCRKIHCLRYFFIIWMTCDLYTPPRGVKGDRSRWRTTRTKRGTTSVACFKTSDFKLFETQTTELCVRRLCFCVRGPRFFLPLILTLNDYPKHTYASNPRLCKYPHKHSDLGLERENIWKRKRICNSVLDPDFGLKGEAVQYSFCLPFILIIAHC